MDHSNLYMQMTKTLQDFKQEVAKELGNPSFGSVAYTTPEMWEKAAERYAEYRAKEAKEEAPLKAELIARCYKKGWNEAIEWAMEQVEEGDKKLLYWQQVRGMIKKGLKS